MAISNFQRLKNIFSTTKAVSDPNPEKQSGDAAKINTIPASFPAESSYVLDRNYQGSSRSVCQPFELASVSTKNNFERLNLQFFLWKNTLQFNLHPQIPVLGSSARIADIATGTG